jgi:probable HAF family extracellular repeat protein
VPYNARPDARLVCHTGRRDIRGGEPCACITCSSWGTVALAPGTALAVPAYTVTDLGTLGGGNSAGVDVNARGQVAGASYTAAGETHAFLWDPAAGLRDLGTLGENYSFGSGINDNGQVTGVSPIAGGPAHAFLWDPAAGMRDLGDLGGGYSSGIGINAPGQVTGSSITPDGSNHVFLWDPMAGMRDLGDLGGGYSSGSGINARGQVTGYSEVAVDGFGLHAFLWDGMSLLDLNDLITPGSGWTLSEGHGINDAGQITGSGFIDGENHAFLLTPVTVAEVPEPVTLALMGAGIIGLGLVRRRKGHSDTGTQARAA